jgi:hypothetical protein
VEYTGATTDIVEGEVRDTLVELEKERQRLSNSAGCAEDGDLGVLFPQATPLTDIHQLERIWFERHRPLHDRDSVVPAEQTPRKLCAGQR